MKTHKKSSGTLVEYIPVIAAVIMITIIALFTLLSILKINQFELKKIDVNSCMCCENYMHGYTCTDVVYDKESNKCYSTLPMIGNPTIMNTKNKSGCVI